MKIINSKKNGRTMMSQSDLKQQLLYTSIES